MASLKIDKSETLQMKIRSPRPYLKCSLKFDWHIPNDKDSTEVLQYLSNWLVEKGFKRKAKLKSWNPREKNVEKSDVKKVEVEIQTPSCSLKDLASGSCDPEDSATKLVQQNVVSK